MIPHELITSTANPRLRAAARLREAPARRASGLSLVDGGREVRRALAAGVPLVELFLDEAVLGRTGHGTHDPDATGLPSGADLDRWLAGVVAGGARITLLSRTAFGKLAFGSRNEGCVGVVRFRPGGLSGWAIPADRPVLIVEGIEKPGNLGAILRTVDAAGLAGVIVCDARTDPANPAVIRASLGTVFSVNLAIATIAETIPWCADARRRVVAAHPQGAMPWDRARLSGATAILLGSEAHGISPAWQEAADAGRIVLESIHLPMHGAADSLNVSATAAILAYESLRQAGPDRPAPPIPLPRS